MKSFKISAIIIAHNQINYTKKCITSLLHSGLYELILINNGSTDGTENFFKEFKKTHNNTINIKIINFKSNVGGCLSRNIGVENASGDTILFLDNDTFLASNTSFIEMSDFLYSSDDTAIVTPLLLFPTQNKIIQAAGGGVTKLGHFGLLQRGKLTLDAVLNIGQSLAWAPTACLMCKKYIFDLSKGFDSIFDPFSLGEDIDFCFNLRNLGYEIRLYPDIMVYHYEGTTFNNTAYNSTKKECFIKNMRFIRDRWFLNFDKIPLSKDEEIKYLYIYKNYDEIDYPEIKVYYDKLGSFANMDDGKINIS